ncbi:phosphotransferase [Amycolatopsis sp. NPDC059657]|uniref:phosphotransferase n=1 Tax=Amycolatopsis sp. NPDC059657 TaxID=3346899 RepID=UPI00366F2B60
MTKDVAWDQAVVDETLAAAARLAGFDYAGAELIRNGSNALYRLPSGVVARIGRPGTEAVARREVAVAEWFRGSGLAAVETLPGIRQPTVVGDRPVTWWALLPEHRPASPAELGDVLRTIHALPITSAPDLPRHDPFADLDSRISSTRVLREAELAWLSDHLHELQRSYGQRLDDDAPVVIHGDAWQGNIAVPKSGQPIVLDLEAVSIGHRAWDLIQLAVDYTDFARITEADYCSFVAAYGGYDVTADADYRLFGDIQELRWVCFALSKADQRRTLAEEARHRFACIRGEVPRPWAWNAI